MSVPEPLAAFLEHLERTRRLSPHTLAAYAVDLERLARLAAARPLEVLDVPTIRHGVMQMHASGRSPRSIARTLSAWRTFYAWRVKHHGLEANPVSGVRAPKAKRALPKALSPEAAAQLLAPEPKDAADRRDLAMFELLYSSGLRLAELVALDDRDAREILAEGEVTVTGKGQKRRRVPVGAAARAALDRWLVERAALAAPGEVALFVGARGARIAPRVVQLRLKRWAFDAGVRAKVHPHVLRHSFASHVLQSSSDLRAVQEMLGHASLATTQVYTSLDFQHLAKVYDAAHPRARKKKSGA